MATGEISKMNFCKRLGPISFILILALSVALSVGCGRERKKSDFELGQEFFQASDYEKAMVRLEKWVAKKDRPNLIEAYAMLAVIYHDYPNRTEQFRVTMEELKRYGEQGMAAVLKLMENKTVGDRLQNTISDVLVHGGSLSVGPLIKDLKSANWRLKINARNTLIKIGEPAVDALVSTLETSDPYTKSLAIEALGKIGGTKAINALSRSISDPSKLVQVSAATALYSMGDKSHHKLIVDALDNPDAHVRVAAAKAAAEVLESPSEESLIKLMNDPDANVRNYAAIALGKAKSAQAVPALIKAMKSDTDEIVKNSAKSALEKIGQPAVDPLIEVLKTAKDEGLIVRAAQALGNIGDRKAIEPLDSIYKRETRPLVKNEVAKALNKIE